jgi:hypothetical protein
LHLACMVHSLSQTHFTTSYRMWYIPSMFHPRSSFITLNMLILYFASQYTVLLLLYIFTNLLILAEVDCMYIYGIMAMPEGCFVGSAVSVPGEMYGGSSLCCNHFTYVFLQCCAE